MYVGTHVLNGYGEIIRMNQLVGEVAPPGRPIVMTSSLAIGKAYDATVKSLAQRDPSGTQPKATRSCPW